MNSAEENRLQLVANEINLGFTLLDSARLAFSMHHTEHGEQALSKAEDAYRGGRHFLGDPSNQETTDSLQQGLNRLRAALDDFQADRKNQSGNELD